MVITNSVCIYGHVQHIVGGDNFGWSIPEYKDFYSNWSSNQSFYIGDTLVFEFESEFHNVMQVSRREYDECASQNPYQAFIIGPATVTLIQDGIQYFICSTADYCNLGQKLSVAVQPSSSSPSTPSTPSSQPPTSQSLQNADHVGPSSSSTVSLMSTTSTIISSGASSFSFTPLGFRDWVLLVCVTFYTALMA
ncbi:hypothetical protein MKW98_032686 [Papaver atlanticum]|uniref:Phytocyanin domain-containing protein n=1 Tax=Papaver atlanticum TaxID=357466 RepID=A0AAD4SXS0_9MAGN|nr:hypothetical protein MKW98_032686 [Papaver atlanticum]